MHLSCGNMTVGKHNCKSGKAVVVQVLNCNILLIHLGTFKHCKGHQWQKWLYERALNVILLPELACWCDISIIHYLCMCKMLPLKVEWQRIYLFIMLFSSLAIFYSYCGIFKDLWIGIGLIKSKWIYFLITLVPFPTKFWKRIL